ncbi:MAG TPA: heat-inducible transcription repressor HrcA [Alphaproteobacteria bacterium]|nr:heat-inducible transcription repressor HrcA [Alphaproteobacteria bacterium]
MGKLNDRAGSVLKCLIDLYTQDGKAVGSKAVCENIAEKISPATIRSVMADLEDKGFLISPHTSAGRVPTEDGLRYYAHDLISIDLDDEVKEKLKEAIANVSDIEVAIKTLSDVVADLTSYTGIILSPKKENEILQAINFMPLEGERVLAILVAKSGYVENRIIEIPALIPAEELAKAAKELNDIVFGKTLEQAREIIIKSLREHKNTLDVAMEKILEEEFSESKSLVVSGQHNLITYPEIVREKLKDLFDVFEEKKLIIGLLNVVKRAEGVQIFIGKDCPLEAAKECSMITASYGTKNSESLGTIGVIGPMRMNYQQTVSIIDYTAKLLSEVLEKKEK